MKASRIGRIISVLLLCFSASAAAEEEIKIPALIGQTGASANFGKNETDGYTLALEEWNARGGVQGKRIALQVEDTQTSQRQIVSAFQRFSLENPPAILGPTWLDAYQAIIPLAQAKSILLLTPSSAREAFSEENREWPITFYHNSTIEIRVLAKGMKDRGYSKVALVYEQEPFAEMIRMLLLTNIPSLAADVGISPGDADHATVLTKLKAARPDVLVIFVWDERSLLSLLQKIRVQLPDLPLASVHDAEGWLKNPAFQEVLPRLIYSRFLIADENFPKKFRARFGYEPLLTASNAYDTLNSLLAARAAGNSTSSDIRKFLLTQELETVTFGKFRFSRDGSVPSRVTVVDFPSSDK